MAYPDFFYFNASMGGSLSEMHMNERTVKKYDGPPYQAPPGHSGAKEFFNCFF